MSRQMGVLPSRLRPLSTGRPAGEGEDLGGVLCEHAIPAQVRPAGLRARKQRLKKRVYGGTRPGRLLKHQVAIKSERWDAQVPGFAEDDLVAPSRRRELTSETLMGRTPARSPSRIP
jgi:hypothetical protein